MWVTINVPDSLPESKIKQRISELEKTLAEEARILSKADVNGQATKKREAILEIMKECSALPDMDPRPPDAILGYDGSAMGLWGDE